MEIEAKFPIEDLKALEEQLIARGCECVHERAFERNVRLDTKKGRLRKDGEVLRVRSYGEACILTFKAPAPAAEKGIKVREEIETGAADAAKLSEILGRLGFIPVFIYEKTRAIYREGDCEFMLDHSPVGDYLEIEGPDEAAVLRKAEELGLDPGTRTARSYQHLFRKWAKANKFKGRDMTFEETGVSAEL